ncbi:unnamed protein product [Pleuronectes platessa]|uniref:Uncharacterized protein n=1 Tax=Pleuronectes platessa TaxID=8262 RepID=A0A9N7UC86_PLEPL|nr:unnamed protein product [Pleuronectes platessa]
MTAQRLNTPRISSSEGPPGEEPQHEHLYMELTGKPEAFLLRNSLTIHTDTPGTSLSPRVRSSAAWRRTTESSENGKKLKCTPFQTAHCGSLGSPVLSSVCLRLSPNGPGQDQLIAVGAPPPRALIGQNRESDASHDAVSGGRGAGQTDFLRHLPASPPPFDVSHIKVCEEPARGGRLSPSSVLHFLPLSSPASGGGGGDVVCRVQEVHGLADEQGDRWSPVAFDVPPQGHVSGRAGELTQTLSESSSTQETDGAHLCFMWRINSALLCALIILMER